MYVTGIVLIFLGALLVNKIAGYKNRKSFFIIELPEYKVPSLTFALKAMCARGWAYIVKAATIILLCNTAVQVMQTFTWSFQVAETADSSILASIAHPFAYLLVPIVGVLSWQLAAAAVTGFIAKENVVGTLAVCFAGLENFIDTEELAMLEGSGAEVAGIIAITKVAALAYLMFNLYTPPCFAAIGAMNSEMKSRKWVWAGIGLQMGVGYTVGYLVYTVGTLITAPAALNVTAALCGLAVVAVFVGVLAALIRNTNRKLKGEYALEKFERVFLRGVELSQKRAVQVFHCERGSERRSFSLRDITYFEVTKRIVTLHYSKGIFEFYSSMEEVEAKLANKGFVRTHRSYLVNVGHIRRLGQEHLELTNGEQVPLGRTYVRQVKERLSHYLTGGITQ